MQSEWLTFWVLSSDSQCKSTPLQSGSGGGFGHGGRKDEAKPLAGVSALCFLHGSNTKTCATDIQSSLPGQVLEEN